MASKKELNLFGNHITTLSEMKVGDDLTLHFFGGVKVSVTRLSVGFYFNNAKSDFHYVGNIYGAIKAYAELCASKEQEDES